MNSAAVTASGRSRICFWMIAAVLLLLSCLGGLTLREAALAEAAREFNLSEVAEWPVMPVRRAYCVLSAYLFRLFGPEEFAVRLPAVFSALVMIYFTARLARRLFGDDAACTAQLMLSGCAGFAAAAGAASDVLPPAAMTVAAVVFFLEYEKTSGFAGKFVFWIIVAVLAWYGGLMYALLPPALLLPYLLGHRRFRRQFTPASAAAFFTALVCYALPFCLLAAGDRDYGWNQALRDALRLPEHFYPDVSALLMFPALLLPWSLPAAVAACAVFHQSFSRYGTRFRTALLGLLLGYAVAVWIGGIDGTTVLLPFSVLLTLWSVRNDIPGGRQDLLCFSVLRPVAAVIGSLFLLTAAVWPVWPRLFDFPIPLPLRIILPAGGAAVLLILLADRNDRPAASRLANLALGFAVIAAVSVGVFRLLPGGDSRKEQFSAFRSEMPGQADGAVMFWHRPVPADFHFYIDADEPASALLPCGSCGCGHSAGKADSNAAGCDAARMSAWLHEHRGSAVTVFSSPDSGGPEALADALRGCGIEFNPESARWRPSGVSDSKRWQKDEFNIYLINVD